MNYFVKPIAFAFILGTFFSTTTLAHDGGDNSTYGEKSNKEWSDGKSKGNWRGQKYRDGYGGKFKKAYGKYSRYGQWVDSVPAPDSSVAQVPSEITLNFAKNIKLTYVQIKHDVHDAIPLDIGGAEGFVNQATIPLGGDANMGQGTYTVTWTGLVQKSAKGKYGSNRYDKNDHSKDAEAKDMGTKVIDGIGGNFTFKVQ